MRLKQTENKEKIYNYLMTKVKHRDALLGPANAWRVGELDDLSFAVDLKTSVDKRTYNKYIKLYEGTHYGDVLKRALNVKPIDWANDDYIDGKDDAGESAINPWSYNAFADVNFIEKHLTSLLNNWHIYMSKYKISFMASEIRRDPQLALDFLTAQERGLEMPKHLMELIKGTQADRYSDAHLYTAKRK